MRKFLAIVLYIAVGLPLLLSSLLALSVRPWAFDRAMYVRVLTDDRLFDVIRSPELAREVDEKLVIGGFSFHGPSLVAAAQKELPVPELKNLATEAVNGSFDFLEGKTDGRLTGLDLRPLKKAVLSRSAALATDYVTGLPVEPRTPAAGDYSFRPRGLPAGLIATRAGDELRRRVTSEVPDSLPWPSGERARSDTEKPAWTWSLARLDFSIAAMSILSLLVVAGLALLGERGASRRFSMAGGLILAPSVVVLITAIFLSATAMFVQKGLIPAELVRLTGSRAGAAFADYFIGATRGIVKSFFVTSLVGTCFGGFLLSLRKWMQPEEIA